MEDVHERLTKNRKKREEAANPDEAAKAAQEAAEKKQKEEAEAKAAQEEADRLAAEEEAEKKEEKPAEGEEKKEEEEEEDEKEVNTLFDKIKAIDPNKQEVEKKEEEKVATVIPDDVKAKLEELEAIKNNPFFQATQLGATKEQIKQIAAEIAGTDYSKKSYEELLTLEIGSITGLQGEELEAEVALAIEEYNSKPFYKRKQEEVALREKFQSVSSGESETLNKLLQAYKPEEKAKPEEMAELFEKTTQAEKAHIRNVGSKLIGGKLYGVEFTEETLNKIIEEEYDVNAVVSYLDGEGNLNAAKFLQDKFVMKNIEAMIEAEAERRAKKKLKGIAVTSKDEKGQPLGTEKINKGAELRKSLGIPDYIIKQQYKDK